MRLSERYAYRYRLYGNRQQHLAPLFWPPSAASSGSDCRRGTGVDDAECTARWLRSKPPSLGIVGSGDGVALIAALGGFEIAAMAGVCIGGAAMRVPWWSMASSLPRGGYSKQALSGICDYLFFAHRSAEGGHQLALAALGVNALLDLGMRLGEGTGAALAMNVNRERVGALPRNGQHLRARCLEQDRITATSKGLDTDAAPPGRRFLTISRCSARGRRPPTKSLLRFDVPADSDLSSVQSSLAKMDIAPNR